MNIKLIKIGDIFNSCNFCSKIFAKQNNRLIIFKNANTNGIQATICEDCLKELYKDGMKLFEDINKVKYKE